MIHANRLPVTIQYPYEKLITSERFRGRIQSSFFNAWNKEIKTNWAFSEKSFQLCLKHGLNNILPPMESPDRLRKSSTSLEAVPKTSEKPGSHLLQKPEISKLLSMNKRKLIVKVGPSRVDPSSNLCTICKTFSSSSNKKLNAHIHECLSLDLPIEPSSISRVIKPRIKPRKTKLMVDVYAKAMHCTLEELDQRNGRICFEKPVLQEDAVNCDEEKKQSVDGAVCIDGNGTKLLILNKVSDLSSVSKLGANHRRLGIMPKWATSKRTGHLKRQFHGDQLSPSEPKLHKSSPRPKYGHDYKEKFLKYQPTDEDAHQVPPKRSTILKIKKKSSLNLNPPTEEPVQDHGDLGISPCEGKLVTGNENVMSLAQLSDQDLYSIGEKRPSNDQLSPSEPKLRKSSPHPKYGHDYKEEFLKYQPTDEDAHQIPPKRSTILKIKKKSSLNLNPTTEESIQDHGDLGISPSEGKLVSGNENVMNLAQLSDQDLYSIGEKRPSNELGNYFSGIDPVSIPGPPGSYLPSPGRTSSYNHHLENSVLTSQLQSSLDNLELVDRESMNSTASNVSLARSDSAWREELSIGPFVPQDEIIKSSFSNKITKSTIGFQDAKVCSLSRKEDNSVNYQDLGSVSVKPYIYGNFGSPSLSSPTSILRLMGKDIMVVNN